MLKLNPDKTEFLFTGNITQRSKFDAVFPISLMGKNTYPSSSVRNLGVSFDQNFNFRKHITKVCQACYYHITDFRRVRRHLDKLTATTLANALVSSRLDYCNSLFYGLPDKDIYKLGICCRGRQQGYITEIS